MSQRVARSGGGLGVFFLFILLAGCRVTSVGMPTGPARPLQPDGGHPSGAPSASVNSDGDLLALKNTTINTVSAYITARTLPSGSLSAPVDNVSGFKVGDEALIIQMQVPAADASLQREFVQIASAVGGSFPTLSFTTPLTYGYISGKRGADHQSQPAVTQIIRVPRYKTVTVSSGSVIIAPGWDKDAGKGGILIFKSVGPVSLVGTAAIRMDATGFTGGYGEYPSTGYQGESHLGRGIQSRDAIGGAGGRGTMVGGAAGYGSDGSGSSGFYSAGAGGFGKSFGLPDLSPIFLGPGGGGAYGISGGAGGGMILIYAPSLQMDKDSAMSADGQGGPCLANVSGGSGAGGSIHLVIDEPSVNGTLSAVGGSGGCGGYNVFSKGGDGRIRVDYSKSSKFNNNIHSNPLVEKYSSY